LQLIAERKIMVATRGHFTLTAITTSSIFVSIAMHNDYRILQRTAQNIWSGHKMKKD